MSPLVLATVVAITPKGTVEWLVASAAALGALATIWKLGLKPLIQFVRAIGEGVEFVRAQMVNNGGSSLKDAIDRTEARADQIVERLDQIDARVEFLEAVHRKQAEVEAIVAANARKLATPSLPPKESA